MGSFPATSPTMSNEPISTAASRYSTARARIPGSSSATRRVVKALDTSDRIRVWRGGSMARNDMDLCAWGP